MHRSVVAAGVAAIVVGSLAMPSTVLAQGEIVAPTPNSFSSSLRGPSSNLRYHRTVFLHPAAELAAVLPDGIEVTSLGFSMNTPQPTAVTANITIYVEASMDVTFTKGTDWATVISPMTEIYNGPITIPATAGTFLVPLDEPFTYDSSMSYYFAYDYQNPAGALAAGAPTYDTTAGTISPGLFTANSPTAPPTMLTASSSFRPSIAFGFDAPATDVAVGSIIAYGQVPSPFGNPSPLSVWVQNKEFSTYTGPFELTVTVQDAMMMAPPKFTSTVNIASIQPNFFNRQDFTWLPTVLETDIITASVTATMPMTPEPPSFLFDNTATFQQIVNATTYDHTDESLPPDGGVGTNGVANTFLSRFVTDRPIEITQLRSAFSSAGESINFTIYSADSVTLLPGSPIYNGATTNTNGDLNTQIADTPTTPVAVNGVFYAGVVQQGAVNMGIEYQSEIITRQNTHYFRTTGDWNVLTEFTGFNVGVEVDANEIVGGMDLSPDAAFGGNVYVGDPLTFFVFLDNGSAVAATDGQVNMAITGPALAFNAGSSSAPAGDALAATPTTATWDVDTGVAASGSSTLTLVYDTSVVGSGTFMASLDASTPADVVSYNDVDMFDFIVTYPGDLEFDGDVDTADLTLFGAAFGAISTDANYTVDADFDLDNVVDLSDWAVMCANWEQVVP